MGADHVIDYVKTPKWVDTVKEITGGRGCDVLYDVVGGESFSQCVRAAARGGRICTGGFVSGTFPQLPMNLVLVKGLYVCSMTSQFPEFKEAVEKKAETLLSWLQDPIMKPHISHTFPLSRIKEALTTMNERQQVGRVVVHCQEF